MSLKVELFDRGGKGATSLPATRVLVLDAYDNPLCAIVEFDDSNGVIQTHVSRIGDDDFDTILSTFGFEAATILRQIHLG